MYALLRNGSEPERVALPAFSNVLKVCFERESPFIRDNCDLAGQRLLILNDHLIEPISRTFREALGKFKRLWADNS